MTKINLPTKITISRIVIIVLMLLTLFVLALIPNLTIPNVGSSNLNWAYLIITVIFLLAAFTDFLDGYLARKNNQVTDLGKFLDPIADKLLVNSMLIFVLVPQSYALTHARGNPENTILMFCVIFMIVRDLVVDMLRFMNVKKGVVIAANIFGKLKTVLQMIAIPLLLLNDWPFSYFDSSWIPWLRIPNLLFYLATIMSVLSGVIYVKQNHNVLKETPNYSQQLVNKFSAKNLSLGSVESLTGGLFASEIASIPGASKIYKGSLLTYSVEEKIKLLEIDKEIIDTYGVVSSQVAEIMAKKGKEILNVDVCVSFTGNAGPSVEPGGMPVGRIYVGIAHKDKVDVMEFNLSGNRNQIRKDIVVKIEDLLCKNY